VRELRQVLARGFIDAPDAVIDAPHVRFASELCGGGGAISPIPSGATETPAHRRLAAEASPEEIAEVYRTHGEARGAKWFGLSRSGFRYYLEKYGIVRPVARSARGPTARRAPRSVPPGS
jgi:hypothetical protein